MKENGKSESASQKMAPLNILIVDDSTEVSELLQYFLQSEGAKVEIARDGAEALSKVNESRFDLILMDLHMPGLSGFDTAVLLKKRHFDKPIVAITADNTPEQMLDNTDSSPFDDVIMKPISPSALMARLLELAP